MAHNGCRPQIKIFCGPQINPYIYSGSLFVSGQPHQHTLFQRTLIPSPLPHTQSWILTLHHLQKLLRMDQRPKCKS